MAGPFEWGRADCCTSACDVFAAVHGFDPMARLRGAYAGPRGALRVIRAAGGMRALAEAIAAENRMRACCWHPGALGLAPVGRHLALVIGLDQPGWWAGKVHGGFAPVRGVEASWRN